MKADRPGTDTERPAGAPPQEGQVDAPAQAASADEAPLALGRFRRDGPVVRGALIAAVIVFIVLPILATWAMLSSEPDLGTWFDSVLSEIGERLRAIGSQAPTTRPGVGAPFPF
jgi:hypothetical protein